MPESALESILCALVRVVLSAVERDQELRFEIDRSAEDIRAAVVVLPLAGRRRSLELDRDDCFELEVQLAEWGGSLSIETLAGLDRVQIALPAGFLDA